MPNSIKILTMIAGLFLKESSDYNEDEGYEQYEQECCEPAEPKCSQLTCEQIPEQTITPNAGPCVNCGSDMFITAEFIAWSAREENLGFVLKGQSVTDAISSSTSKGSIIHPNWKLEPGFKVGGGILFDYDGWDLSFNYTWLVTKTNRTTVNSTPTKTLTDLNWLQSPINPIISPISQTSAKWRHNFNVLDLDLGRNFFISQCLLLRPHFGFKGTWQKQKMDVAGTGLNPQSTSAQTMIGAAEYVIATWGIGVRAGFDSAWHFTPCLSIFGEFSGTVLWQRFDSEAEVVVQNQSTQLYTVPIHAEDAFAALKSVFEGSFGLRWEDWFCDNSYHWSMDLGWELQWWGDQNQFINTLVETRTGNLGLQGLTLKLRLDF